MLLYKYTEPCINPAIEKQAIGRVHRIGQSRNVHVKYMLVNNTIEERLVAWNQKRFNNKKDTNKQVKNEPGIKLENSIKREKGIKSEPGLQEAYHSDDNIDDDNEEQTGNTAIDTHSAAIPGNVKEDVLPMRLAELEMLFGDTDTTMQD